MFRWVALLNAVICLALFPLLLLSPGSYVEAYGVAADPGADFLGRRASPMFLGLAVLFWMIRDAPPGPARRAVAWGVALMWVGIGLTGIYEFIRDTASSYTVVAAVIEAVLAGMLVAADRAQPRP